LQATYCALASGLLDADKIGQRWQSSTARIRGKLSKPIDPEKFAGRRAEALAKRMPKPVIRRRRIGRGRHG
jgi:hypothetical protein